MSGIYTQLENQQIRVLRLHSGTFHDDICVSLLPQDLEDGEGNEAYEAVSYVWGKPEMTKTIRCNGHEISVTENVHKLLCYLRLRNASRCLWIDAICIDQRSKERSQQVSLMQKIYRNASQVLIWFGPDDNDTEALISVPCKWHERPHSVARLSQWALVEKEHFPRLHSFSGGMAMATMANGFGFGTTNNWSRLDLPREWSNKSSDKSPEEEIDIIKRFARNPWFHRAWTFQEAFLASKATAICGRFSFPWTHVLTVVQKLALEGCLQAIFGSAADSMAALAHYSTPTTQATAVELDFLNILRLVRNREATDDRDKIFSILGLPYADNDLGIHSDHVKCPTEVYVDCARTILNRQGNLSLLSCCLRPIQDPTHDLCLPSWVPDWRTKRQAAGLKRFAFSIDRKEAEKIPTYYNQSHTSDSIVTGSTLYQRGIFLDTISSADSAHEFSDLLKYRKSRTPPRYGFDLFRYLGPEPYQFTSFAGEFHKLLSSMSLGHVYIPTGETSQVALLRTLAANRLPTAPKRRECVKDVAKIAYRGLKNLFLDVEKLLNQLEPDSESLRHLKAWIHQIDADGKLGDYESAINFCYRSLKSTSQERREEILDSTDTHLPWREIPWRNWEYDKQDDLRAAATWMETLLPYVQQMSEGNNLGDTTVQDLRDFLLVCDLAFTPPLHTLPRRRPGIAPFTRCLIFGELQDIDETMGALVSAMATFAAFRHLFKMDNGWIGLGPDHMEEGDEVWDLNGAEVPFILRPEASSEQQAGGRRYKLVGECYVHGVTKGEPWLDVVDPREPSLRSEDDKVETICIV